MEEKKGIVKVYWKDVRTRVAKVEPTFAKIIDELSPDKSFPLYLAYYPYGALIADPEHMYLPQEGKTVSKFIEANASKDVLKNLDYGKNSLAMGMVLEKNIEVFIDFKDECTSIPWLIYSPGTFFPYAKTLSQKRHRQYAPNNILTIISGARSAFMLPNIGCQTNHINLQRDFHVQSPPPKSLYEHWQIFKEIYNSEVTKSEWRSCLMFFSEKWVEHLMNDRAWVNLKMYLHELAWNHFEYRRNYIYHEIAFSRIQKKRNLKPNPYLTDTAAHLFATALGAAPGYVPACDENSLPLRLLKKAFIDSYGLNKYYPIIMQPAQFNFDTDKLPVYYSLQNPSTFVFSPKSRKLSSTLFELHELEHIMRVFIDELSSDNSMYPDTIFGEMTKKLQIQYFHNETDRHKIVKPSEEVFTFDKRFISEYQNKEYQGATFPADAKFLRGCVSISTKS